MTDLTLENLRAFVLVLLGVAAIIVSLDKGVSAFHHLRGTQQQAEKEHSLNRRLTQLENRVTLCEERLHRGDLRFDATAADLTMLLETMSAVLMHMYSDNDKEKLRATMEKLNNYMTKRGNIL